MVFAGFKKRMDLDVSGGTYPRSRFDPTGTSSRACGALFSGAEYCCCSEVP